MTLFLLGLSIIVPPIVLIIIFNKKYLQKKLDLMDFHFEFMKNQQQLYYAMLTKIENTRAEMLTEIEITRAKMIEEYKEIIKERK
jgi:hypothetical protein